MVEALLVLLVAAFAVGCSLGMVFLTLCGAMGIFYFVTWLADRVWRAVTR